MANVLVVDDAAFMRLSIRKMLEANGHTMAGEAGNGIDAIKKYEAIKPDVVILDITMPHMNGIEALKRIREKDPTAKVIICSALGQQKVLAQAIECGATNFIVKPFEEHVLMAAIDKVLS